MKTKTHTPPRLIAAPVACCEEHPHGLEGSVEIEGATYGILYVESRDAIIGWRVIKADGFTIYDIDADGMVCDCPDASYRNRACKHVLSVNELVAAKKLLVGLKPLPQTAKTTVHNAHEDFHHGVTLAAVRLAYRFSGGTHVVELQYASDETPPEVQVCGTVEEARQEWKAMRRYLVRKGFVANA